MQRPIEYVGQTGNAERSSFLIIFTAIVAAIAGVAVFAVWGAAGSTATAATGFRAGDLNSEELSDFDVALIECVGKDAACSTAYLEQALDVCRDDECVEATLERYEREAEDALVRLEERLPAVDREIRSTPAWAAATDSFIACAQQKGLPDAQSGDPAAVRRALQAEMSREIASATSVSERPSEFDDASTDNPKGVPALDPLPEMIEAPNLEAIAAADSAGSQQLDRVDECQASSGLIELEQQMLIEALNGAK